MPVLHLDRVEARSDPGGPVRVTGEEDVLGQVAWTESDVVLPFSVGIAMRRSRGLSTRVSAFGKTSPSLTCELRWRETRARIVPRLSRASSRVERALVRGPRSRHARAIRADRGGRRAPSVSARGGRRAAARRSRRAGPRPDRPAPTGLAPPAPITRTETTRDRSGASPAPAPGSRRSRCRTRRGSAPRREPAAARSPGAAGATGAAATASPADAPRPATGVAAERDPGRVGDRRSPRASSTSSRAQPSTDDG